MSIIDVLKNKYFTKDFLSRNRTVFENFSYMAVLQVFIMLTPLISYPYLVRVLGNELYGLVITSTIVASYASVLVNFGFREIGAKFISIYRDDKQMLSKVLSSILSVRGIIWLITLFIYLLIIYLVPLYRGYYLLFVLAYGVTLNELLFPQFFFQGIEKMKYISLINLFTRSFFIVLIFIFVRNQEDYLFYPLLTLIGNLLAGLISLYVIYKVEKVELSRPDRSIIKMMMKDSIPIFATDLICTIKDKLNYLLIGHYVGYSQVTTYDLGSKLTSVLVKPAGILQTVLFPKLAKERSISVFKKAALISTGISLILVCGGMVFLNPIVSFFNPEITNLIPIRIYLIAPIVLTLSGFIAGNFLIAFGHGKYVLFSIILTTIGYLFGLFLILALNLQGNILSFIILTVFSYTIELIYRMFVLRSKQDKFEC